MAYKITLRESGREVKVQSQPEFQKQVDRNRAVRHLTTCPAEVLFVRVQLEDGSVINVDTKALIVHFYHSKDKVRLGLFAQATQAMHDGDKVLSEELFWLAVTKVSLIDSGAVNEDGSLKRYSQYKRLHETPLSADEVHAYE